MGTPKKDVVIKPDAPSTLFLEKHADYIASYGAKKDDYFSTFKSPNGLALTFVPEIPKHEESSLGNEYLQILSNTGVLYVEIFEDEWCLLRTDCNGSHETAATNDQRRNLAFVKSCQRESGGISASIGHDLTFYIPLVLSRFLPYVVDVIKLLTA